MTSNNRNRKDRKKKLGMESLESRYLLTTANPSFHFAVEGELAPEVRSAFERVSDLTQYTSTELATSDWVVRIADGHTRNEVATTLKLNTSSMEPTGLIDDTYVIRQTGAITNIISSLEGNSSVEYFYPLVTQQLEKFFTPDDTRFRDQWHLNNTGQTGGTRGEDANILNAWDNFTGKGVVIGIVDDGLDGTHPDLAYRRDLSFDFNDNDTDPSPGSPADGHGTAVAGVAAAIGNNDLGVTGSGFEAEVAGMRLLGGPVSDLDIARALEYKAESIDISNNSWGPGGPYQNLVGPLSLSAIAENSRAANKTIYVFSNGNSLREGLDSNYLATANNPDTIAVTAINDDGEQSFYANPGANILVAAHSNEPGIVTTDIVGDGGYTPFPRGGTPDDDDDSNYATDFGGTSSAAPLVSGIIALMREANPNLSYRDVQHILVETARLNDPNDSDWVQNGAGHDINHKYGFGAIDAEAAVEMAILWTPLQDNIALTSDDIDINLEIPDGSTVGTRLTVGIPDTIDNVDGEAVDLRNDFSIEHVLLTLEVDHTFRGDLRIELTSPDGTVSVLSEPHQGDAGAINNWTYSTMRHWDETPAGNWHITIADEVAGDIGMFESAQISFIGDGVDVGGGGGIIIEPPTDNGVITGTIFDDTDGDGFFDNNEDGVRGQTVFLDSNNNGIFDADERSAITGPSGAYYFTGLPVGGSYTIGYVCNVDSPAVKRAIATRTAIIGLSGISSGNDFVASEDCLPGGGGGGGGGGGDDRTIIEGEIFNDVDGDGIRDLGESAISGMTVYADLNDNCVIGLGEPSGVSDASGRYSLSVATGQHFIRMVPHPGSQLTSCQGSMISAPGDVLINHNIAFSGDNEFDTAADGTAMHGIYPGLRLGEIVSSDTTVEDNDGVIFSSGLVAGQTEEVVVIAQKIAVSTAYLQGWIDWNGDGNFGAGEQVFRNVELNNGINTLNLSVPTNASTNGVKALFRYGFERNLDATTTAVGGEAESYILDVPPGGETGLNAIDDTAMVPAGGSVTIDVLGNDTAGLLGDGTLTIISVSSPDAVIEGNQIIYTPGPGAAAVESFTYTIEDSRGGTDTATVTVNVQFELPLARPETAEAIAGTGNTIDVVANDFSTAGEGTGVTITDVQGSSNATVTISDDNQIIYTPDASFEGTDTFTYTITDDQNGQTSTTTVTVNVVSSGPLVEIELQVRDAAGNEITGPITVGQEFFLVGIVRDLREGAEAEGVFSAFLDVVLSNSSLVTIGDIDHEEYPNDVSGTVVGNQIDEIGGVTEVDSNGNVNGTAMQLFSVSMTAVAEGTLSFLGDPADLMANDTTLLGLDAEVSGNLINFINDSIVINDLSGDRVNYEIRVTDLAGNSIESVGVNQDFQVEIYVQDLTNRAQSGVFAGYLDVNFDPSRVQLNGTIVHGADYQNGTSGDTGEAGLIDELGGFDGLSALGSDPVLLATIPLTAISAGQVEFTGDPADDEAQHATLLFGENSPVDVVDLRYSADTLTISGEAANGPLTNSVNALDVTGDGNVTPLDALAVINDLNKNGARDLSKYVRQSRSSAPMIDVNGDGNATALDALLVINHLNTPQTDARAAMSASAEEPVALPGIDVWSTWSDLDSDDESDDEWLEDVTAAIQENSDVS